MSDMYQYPHQAQGYVPHQLMTQMGPQAFAPYLQPEVPFRDLQPEDVTLLIRQQPVEALIAIDGKEKARKPLDPAPIVELRVQNKADPPKYFLQSPYLFVCVTLVEADRDDVVKTHDNKCALVGSVVSSLHRIKDASNHDGGFFVWGDISCRVLGQYRLKFSLFDFRVRGDNRSAVYLQSICSEPFEVVAAKDFSGMKESTLLSRTFQAQGIRLRLRKEPRASAYRNSSPANPKKRNFEEVDEDEEELAGGAVQRPTSGRSRTTPQAAVEYAAVHAANAIHQQQAAAAASSYHATGTESSTHSTPPSMYTHPSQGFIMGGRSPQEFVGNTPSPSYQGAALANSPLPPAYTAAPYAGGVYASGAPSPAAFSAPFSSAPYPTSGLAAGAHYPAPLTYTSVAYAPYPALSIAADGALTDPQLSVGMPSTPMTNLPLFSEDSGDHAWTTTAHSNVLGLSNEFTPSEFSGNSAEYNSNAREYNGPLNLDLSGMGN